MEAFYEPNWETGAAVRWRISNTDGTPLGVAGLWSAWHAPDNRWVFSATMLTINADGHPVMQRFHKPDDEKRMVVVLNPVDYEGWLKPSASDIRSFLQRYDSEKMFAEPAPLPPKHGKVTANQDEPASDQGLLF